MLCLVSERSICDRDLGKEEQVPSGYTGRIPRDELIRLREAGVSIKLIAKKYDVVYQTISRRLKDENIGERKKGVLPSSRFYLNNALSFTKGRAKREGHEWALSEEQFCALINCPCHYCGTEKSNCIKAKSKWRTDFHYNGIDRKDSSKGYTPENSLPCCKFCNLGKRERPYEDFISWIHKASEFLKRRDCENALQKSFS